jgi:hypothetical protein
MQKDYIIRSLYQYMHKIIHVLQYKYNSLHEEILRNKDGISNTKYMITCTKEKLQSHTHQNQIFRAQKILHIINVSKFTIPRVQGEDHILYNALHASMNNFPKNSSQYLITLDSIMVIAFYKERMTRITSTTILQYIIIFQLTHN